MTTADLIVEALLGEIQWDDRPPAYASVGYDDDAELDNASRSAFNAHEYAIRTRKHHPKLWAAVKGTPFEPEYRRNFGPWIDVDARRNPPLA